MKALDLRKITVGALALAVALAFVPLAFLPEHTQLAHIPLASGVTDLKVLSVARLMLDNFDHIRQLWNYVDEKLLQLSLSYGVDDLG